MNWLHSTRKGLENKSTEIEEDLSPEVMAEMLRRLDIPLKPSPRRNLFTWLIAKIPLSHFVLSAFGVMLLWGIQSAIFQPPPSFDASGSVTIIEFIDAPIIEMPPMPPLKPPLVNRARGSSGGETGNQENDSAQKTAAADSRNDIESDKGSWEQTKGPYGGYIITLHATPEGVLFSGTLSGYIFRSADGGSTWQPASEGLPGHPSSVRGFVQNGDTIYADIDNGYFYSTNGGDLWQQLTYFQDGGRISEIAIIGNTIYITRLRQQSVFFSNDNGKSWAKIDNGLTDQGNPLLFTSGSTVFAQMEHHVFRLKDGENAWKKLIIDVESDITKFVVSGEIIYAVTVDGELFRSTDLGDWWHAIKPEGMQSFDGEMAVVQNTIFCIDSSSAGRRVFRSVDAGDSWTMFNTNWTNQRLCSITALSQKMLYVGTNKGIFRSTDAGDSWTKASAGITYTGMGDLVSFRNALYTVAGEGIFKSVDGGESWLLVNDGLIANGGAKMAGRGGILDWSGVKLAVSGGKLYAATCKGNSSFWNPDTSGIFYLAEDENSWLPIHTKMPSFNGDRINAIGRLAISGQTFYIIAHKRIYRWRMGENLWTDIGLRVLNEEGFAVSGGTIYIARKDGKLLRSVDEGDTLTDVSQRLPDWNLLAQQDYQRSIYDLHFVDKTIYAGTKFSVFRSTDADGTLVYDGYYRVFRSTDGGETWESVVDGLPRGALNIQLVFGTTLYGANTHGIFRLRHGADSWERHAPIQHTVWSLAFDGRTFYAKIPLEGIFRFSLDE